ncbi:hypothetical protein GCM10010313_47850 [Streptomyces violarus]|nr:hypothetical protein GCM10010313_47850 [Streptomyces violarus]
MLSAHVATFPRAEPPRCLIYRISIDFHRGSIEGAPGEAVAPGVVLLLCGVVVAVLGVALVVLVLRMLLAQAVARDIEAARMRAEWEEVI